MNEKLKRSELIEIEASELRVENEKATRELQRAQANIDRVQSLASETEVKAKDDLASLQKRQVELEIELNEMKEQVRHYRNNAASENEDHRSDKALLERRIKSLLSELGNCRLEKKLVSEEVNDLRLLLSQSQGALESITVDRGERSPFIQSRNESNLRSIHVQERVQQLLDLEADKARSRQQSHTPTRHSVDTVETNQHRPTPVLANHAGVKSSYRYDDKWSSAKEVPSETLRQTTTRSTDVQSFHNMKRNPATMQDDGVQHTVQPEISSANLGEHLEKENLRCSNSRTDHIVAAMSTFKENEHKPPVDVVIRKLSLRICNDEDEIQRDEESIHSLDTFMTWDTAGTVQQIKSKNIVKAKAKREVYKDTTTIVEPDRNITRRDQGRNHQTGEKTEGSATLPNADEQTNQELSCFSKSVERIEVATTSSKDHQEMRLSHPAGEQDNGGDVVVDDDDDGYASSDFETESTCDASNAPIS